MWMWTKIQDTFPTDTDPLVCSCGLLLGVFLFHKLFAFQISIHLSFCRPILSLHGSFILNFRPFILTRSFVFFITWQCLHHLNCDSCILGVSQTFTVPLIMSPAFELSTICLGCMQRRMTLWSSELWPQMLRISQLFPKSTKINLFFMDVFHIHGAEVSSDHHEARMTSHGDTQNPNERFISG